MSCTYYLNLPTIWTLWTYISVSSLHRLCSQISPGQVHPLPGGPVVRASPRASLLQQQLHVHTALHSHQPVLGHQPQLQTHQHSQVPSLLCLWQWIGETVCVCVRVCTSICLRQDAQSRILSGFVWALSRAGQTQRLNWQVRAPGLLAVRCPVILARTRPSCLISSPRAPPASSPRSGTMTRAFLRRYNHSPIESHCHVRSIDPFHMEHVCLCACLCGFVSVLMYVLNKHENAVHVTIHTCKMMWYRHQWELMTVKSSPDSLESLHLFLHSTR